ncbi:MAG TPA: oligosaccharide flippase family protein [Thermoanaerobaculia bacterium]|nr:oligosaccharide flippase family protein [Thermoanaerobaculia bacterium]
MTDRQSSTWDIRNAPANYAWLVVFQVASSLLSFATVWLITRRLGATGYGAVVAVVLASQIMQIFLHWSATSLQRFGVEEFVASGAITKSFWTRSLIFLPNLLLLLVTAFAWLGPMGKALEIPREAWWMVALHLVTSSVWMHIQHALQGAKLMRLQGLLLAVERGLTFAAAAALYASGRLSWVSALVCYIAAPVLTSIVGLVRLRPYVRFDSFYDAGQFRTMLRFSLPLIPFAIIGALSTNQLDGIFITQYLSKKALGIYAIATQINGIAGQLPMLANLILLSMFVSLKSTGQESLLSRFFQNVAPPLTLAWGFFCALLSTAAALLIPVFFNADFDATVHPLWILLASSTLAFPVLMGLASLANTYSKTYISMIAAIAAALLNVLFNFLLIPRYGLMGCAWATLIAMAASLVTFQILLRREGLLSGGWILASVLPTIAGAIVISWDGRFAVAFAVCAALTLAIGLLERESYRKLISFWRARL